MKSCSSLKRFYPSEIFPYCYTIMLKEYVLHIVGFSVSHKATKQALNKNPYRKGTHGDTENKVTFCHQESATDPLFGSDRARIPAKEEKG